MEAVAEQWWTAIQERRLLVQACRRCGHAQHPPSAICRACLATDALEWVEHSGRGEIASFTRMEVTSYDAFDVPYWIVYVRMHGLPDVFVLANFDHTATSLQVGDPVQIRFIERADGRLVPEFAALTTGECDA